MGNEGVGFGVVCEGEFRVGGILACMSVACVPCAQGLACFGGELECEAWGRVWGGVSVCAPASAVARCCASDVDMQASFSPPAQGATRCLFKPQGWPRDGTDIRKSVMSFGSCEESWGHKQCLLCAPCCSPSIPFLLSF